MAVPRNRHSNARKNSRRAHDAMKPVQTGKCTHCGKAVLPHRVCNHCGHYKNLPVIRQEQAEE